MLKRIAGKAFKVCVVCAIVAGCTDPPVGTTDPGGNAFTRLNEDTFVDSGGFFTIGEGAGTVLPFEPETEEERATESFFAVRAIDPFSEDSAGPKFVKWGDLDLDGLPDLATVWNQSQVIQLQFQRRDAEGNITFESVQVDGNSPLAIMAGLELSDIDRDGQLDLIILVKHNATLPICPGNGQDQDDAYVGEVVILFSPTNQDVTDGALWKANQVRLPATRFGANMVDDRFLIEEALMTQETNQPCNDDANCVGGRTCINNQCITLCANDADCPAGESCAPNGVCVMSDTFCVSSNDCSVGEACVDNRCRLDILGLIDDNFPGLVFGDDRVIDVPENGGMNALAVGDITGDGFPDIVLTSNVPAPPCHNGINEVELYPNPGAGNSRTGTGWQQIILDGGGGILKDIVINDVDADGDLDVVVTRLAISQNVHWLVNPIRDPVLSRPVPTTTAFWNWSRRSIGQVDGGADVMAVGDVDGDGLSDVLLRSNGGRLIQWFRHPNPNDDLNVEEVTAGIPWSVYTLFELVERVPLGITVGDINFDGQVEVILAADGSVFWLDSSTAPTVFDEWSANLIADDILLDTALFASSGPAFINDLLVLDIDCDGANDVIATMDRRPLSGLSTDVVLWFRNVLLPEDVGLETPLVPGCP